VPPLTAVDPPVSLGEPSPFSLLESLHAALPMPSTAMSVNALETNVLMMNSTLTAWQLRDLLGMVQKKRTRFKEMWIFTLAFNVRCAAVARTSG
jgi:hypothetical protein